MTWPPFFTNNAILQNIRTCDKQEVHSPRKVFEGNPLDVPSVSNKELKLWISAAANGSVKLTGAWPSSD